MKHTIEVTKTAHYHYNPAKGNTKGIVIAIHGYAQLASEFIEEFSELSTFGYDVYAPEALSTFYNKLRKPVANWMTTHEREDEIRDYINFLNKFTEAIKLKHSDHTIYLIGFSQGVSTLLRWYAESSIVANEVHLIAGSIPVELTAKSFKKTNNQYFYYHGIHDLLVKKEQAEIYWYQLKKLNVSAEYISFNGRHEIPEKLLARFRTT
ncbi:MAG: putative esterase [Vicingaceae bacterium]|jgi:predicted esterase